MWNGISYLASETPSQQRAYECLTALKIFPALSHYSPTLVSTLCLDIDIPTSDLDIICEVHDHHAFIAEVHELYGSHQDFSSRRSERTPPATVIRFVTEQFEIELFGQAVPIEQQSAYRHLIQIERVLRFGGQQMREEIRALKCQGLKTEPAVAQLLGLAGDPYQAIFDLASLSDPEVANRVHTRDKSSTP